MGPAADFAVLQFAFEKGELWPIAVLLLDCQDRLHVRARAADDLAKKIPPDDVEVIALSLDQIAEDARTGSGREILETLEDRLSNTIRISERQKARISNIQNTLDSLYQQHVSSEE
jgi:DNA invertase Pin-like site-specific DNA recombinase